MISAIVLLIYYPSLSAPINYVDDYDQIKGLMNWSGWHLANLFIPHVQNGLYYRPMVILSFLVDKKLWLFQPDFMHLENILIHLASTLLVFWLTWQIIPKGGTSQRYLPLIAALVFGLHPINTESVNWISGRTDLLAGFFVLLSANLLLVYKKHNSRISLLGAALAFLLGALSKEVALAFLPGAFFLLLSKDATESSEAPADKKKWFRNFAAISFLGGGGVGLFFFLRSLAISSNKGTIALTLKIICTDFGHAIIVCLGALGFYIKKFFLPLPLNFAIVSVDPLYQLLGMPIGLFCLYLVFRRSYRASLFLAGVFLISPAFLLAFNQIAWTPYAERYLYIASGFLTISTVLFVGERIDPFFTPKQIGIGVVTLLAVASVATFHRNLIWQSNVSLYADTVKKSPNAKPIRIDLGIALMKKGRYKDARKQLEIAGSLYDLWSNQLPEINLGDLDLAQKHYKAARLEYLKVLKKSKGKSVSALKNLILLVNNQILEDKKVSKEKLNREYLVYLKQLYTLQKKPLTLYRMGQISIALGEKKAARNYFKKAYNAFPADSMYKGFSKKLIRKLGES